ncbi:MAG: UDP-N-acetylglucosamine 2-epimerase (non-hydrolyzing) [Bacteroidetes bacterium]|nr:MAG: UDP-N-acetylglucosamine 2-epimerase (non-hydrolyzing) [Bacteroidota bacterium]
MKVINVVGTRPNFMKIAPIIREMNRFPQLEQLLVHTGQHYDHQLSHSFFEELQIPEPDINLNIGSDTHAKQVARIMSAFEDVCDDFQPDVILVVGDVNSTMACTLVAVKKGIKVIHVEAGIRSGDLSMPEEINRLVTDSIAQYLMPPSRDAVDNLLKEGRTPEQILMVGNVMIDTLLHSQMEIDRSDIVQKLELSTGNYVTLTLHRPSNVDHEDKFRSILDALKEIQKEIPVVFPIHPRTKKMLEQFGLDKELEQMPNLHLTNPLGYFDFGRLVRDSRFVLTDSGGIQEETTYYGIPCITLRENTERPVTITEGTNELVGADRDKILEHFRTIMSGNWKRGGIPELWDGQSAQRIVDFILKLN